MTVKFKKLVEEAVLPARAHEGDAGVDITALSVDTEINECGELIIVYHTGIAVEIPEGYFGAIFARSGLAFKQNLRPVNCVGVIDADYRGEWIAHIVIDEQGDTSWGDVIKYKRGDRILQVLIVPFKKVDI